MVRHSDDTVTTEADHSITYTTKEYRRADADARVLTTLIVAQWQQSHRRADNFQIASDEELFGYYSRSPAPARISAMTKSTGG